jgi:hypothetical protein
MCRHGLGHKVDGVHELAQRLLLPAGDGRLQDLEPVDQAYYTVGIAALGDRDAAVGPVRDLASIVLRKRTKHSIVRS